MRLYWSSRSPFVRKVSISAHELGMFDKLECVPTVVKTEEPNQRMMEINPLNRIPVLITDDGMVIHDSAVICEWLDATFAKGRLFPPDGPVRWDALRRQTMADALMDYGLLRRGETRRRSPSEIFAKAYETKVGATLDALNAEADRLASESMTIGEIAIVCALSHLDFRFAEDNWRAGRGALDRWFEKISQRPSVQATAFQDVR